ncbi:MAG TPA: SMP-30/gluconolactonase/LRE family protein [Polyangia bacterium]|jgi:gluconolactonase
MLRMSIRPLARRLSARARFLTLALLPLSLAASCATTSPSPATAPVAATADVFPGAGAPAPLPAPTEGAFDSLEGPLWVANQKALLFSDVVEANGAGAHIFRFDPAQRRYTALPTPPAGPTSTNGLTSDPQGRLIVCERYNARVVRHEPDGKVTVLAERWPVAGGPALNAPNDVTARADGNIYFTDSDWGARPGVPHAAMGVYRVSPTGELSRVLELEKPNGIALSPDGASLYVGSDVQAKVWRLPLDATGAAGTPTVLIDGPSVTGGFKVPDGICVDDTGNLYVANNDDSVKAIVVFDPAGHSLGRIALPFRPSNCTFGGADRRTLYVTTLHAVYEVRVPTPGLP